MISTSYNVITEVQGECLNTLPEYRTRPLLVNTCLKLERNYFAILSDEPGAGLSAWAMHTAHTDFSIVAAKY